MTPHEHWSFLLAGLQAVAVDKRVDETWTDYEERTGDSFHAVAPLDHPNYVLGINALEQKLKAFKHVGMVHGNAHIAIDTAYPPGDTSRWGFQVGDDSHPVPQEFIVAIVGVFAPDAAWSIRTRSDVVERGEGTRLIIDPHVVMPGASVKCDGVERLALFIAVKWPRYNQTLLDHIR